MKKWFTLVVMALMAVGANAQEQTVLETQNSGCLSKTRGYMDEYIPAIVLNKEGSILSVEVQNFISNCATSDFVVNFSMSEGNNGEPCTLSAEVLPVGEEEADCMCPYNVSFTVRDLEANTFYLNCGWYKGMVELTEGKPLVLKEKEEASDYRPLVEKGKRWTYHYNAYQDVYDYYYTLEGDTVISGKNCLKMYSDNRYNDHVFRYEGSLFEEDKKVYCFYPGLEDGRLLYDFSCEVGSRLKMTGADLIVLSIADVELNGIDIKRFDIKAQQMIEGEDDPFVIGTLSWIEGVGATKDFFNMLPLAGNYNSLTVCEVNGEILYNGVTNGITTVHNDLKSGHTIYDLRGRRLKSPSKGINIIRQSDDTTRKVVVR